MTDPRLAFAIDPATNDLFLDGSGNIATVSNAEAVGQHVKQRLQTYSGEWFLNTTVGVPWLEEILGGKYDPALAESVVKTEILNTDMVTGISSFSVGFDQRTRGVIIKGVTVETEYDEDVRI